MIAKSIQYNNNQNNINGSLYDVNLGRNIVCGVNSAGDGDYDPTGLIELIETLTLSRCLRTLNLERNYIGMDSCKALGTLLETKNPLSHLKYEINLNSITSADHCVTCCGDCSFCTLYVCTSLKACSLTSQEIIEVVSKMKKNTHLQILK